MDVVSGAATGHYALVRTAPERVLLSGVVVAITAAGFTAWLVGDLSEIDYGGGLDYMVQPLPISAATMTGLGVVSLALYVAVTVFLGWSWPSASQRMSLPQWVLLPTTVGVIVGVGYRVITAGVIGANIGGGLIVLFGVPVCVCLVTIAVRRAPHEPPRANAEQ